jgi:hypothetical protein
MPGGGVGIRKVRQKKTAVGSFGRRVPRTALILQP